MSDFKSENIERTFETILFVEDAMKKKKKMGDFFIGDQLKINGLLPYTIIFIL